MKFNIKNLFNKNKKDRDDIALNINVASGSVSSDTFKKAELSEEDKKAQSAAETEIIEKKKKRIKLIKKIVIIVLIIAAVIVGFILYKNYQKKSEEKKEIMKQVSKVTKMNLSSELSGSGTLAAKDSYTVTSLVEGTVKGVYFEQGDIVKKGDLLIELDSASAERTVTNASTSIAKAKEDFERAKYEYDKILDDYSGNTYKAPISGYLKTLKVKAGDKLSNNTEIGTILDDSKFKITVPFLSQDAQGIKIGDTSWIVLQENDEIIRGTVTEVGNADQIINGGAMVRYVTSVVTNPGGLTSDYNGLVSVLDKCSVEDAPFVEYNTETMKYTDSTNKIEVVKILVPEGSYVTKGQAIFSLTPEGTREAINSKKSSYLSAQESIIKSETTLENAWDAYENYYITAPIDGKVISKNVKIGDKIQRNSGSSATTLCTIYDLTELTFSMSIDEMDITQVEVGQKVNVTADAFSNKRFNGEITEVSWVAANSNGVTNYPVTVTITDFGDLLPGMNVDGSVVLAQAKDAICVPTDALQRGDVVYVLNTSPTIKNANGNIDQEGISDRVKNMVPDGFTAVKVTKGISNENYIQITSGLQEGDEVYVTKQTTSNNMFPGGMGEMGGMGGPPGGGMGGGPRN